MIVRFTVKTLTPVIAPYTFPPHLVVPKNKYSQETLEHLDRVFIRINNKAAILGNTVRASIKRALGKQGVPMKMPTILYMLFPEERTTIYSFSLKNRNGKQTLVTTEIILPDTNGELYADESIKDVIKKEKLIITVGWKRNQGFGRILVDFSKEKRGDP